MQIFAETERLLLRALVAGDDQGIFDLDSDAEVHRYLGKKPIATIEQAQTIIQFVQQQYIDNGIGRWAVIEKERNCFIGWAGLKLIKEPINNHIDFYEVGYRFIKKYWGKGYATEAAKASVDYGLHQLKLDDVYGMADANNTVSRKVLEKAGLKYIETFDLDGEPHDWFKTSFTL